jgi:hypothetical protein
MTAAAAAAAASTEGQLMAFVRLSLVWCCHLQCRHTALTIAHEMQIETHLSHTLLLEIIPTTTSFKQSKQRAQDFL